jgi:anti-repressor protein
MYELIKVTENNGKQAVSARELYENLGYAVQHWAGWYSKNIVNNQFAIENEDYTELPLSGRSIDFALSIDFAKKICMLARTEAGEKIRNYFIEVERRFNKQPLIPQSLPEALRLAADLAEKVQERERQLEAAKPKIAFAEAVAGSSNSILIRELAKLIAQNGYDIGQDRLFEWLVQKNFIIRKRRWSATKGQYLNEYEPSQLAINMGILESSERVIGDGNNGTFTKITVKVTGKGQEYLVNRIMNEYRKEAV